MAQKGVQLDEETFYCSVCLDLLTKPVTIPCGHSYCMNCIKAHWDGQDEKKLYSCPQCRQTLTPRPALVKNTMLAALVEELKKMECQDAAADCCYAGAEDVACDVCYGRKLKAVKSCLQCLVSYCEKHLQPHYQSPTFKNHKLVDPSEKLQENICPQHHEVMNMFCRHDQQCICYLCPVNEHKGHDTVSVAAERTEKQKELEVNRQKVQQKIHDKENDVKVFGQEVEAINCSADEAVQNSEKMFTELIRLMEQRRSDVKEQIRSQQETEVSRVKELQKELEQEISELRRKDVELEKLSHIDDHNQFLHSYPSVLKLTEPADSPGMNMCLLRYFEDVTAAVLELRSKIQPILTEEWTNISLTIAQVDVLLSNPQTEPKTRAEFLKYSCKITLDPNTAHTQLSVSKGEKRITLKKENQRYSHHSDRFRNRYQVLSRESLTGRCYWEVEFSGNGRFSVAVAYKDIKREGFLYECVFGYNDKSWALDCHKTKYEFWFNNVQAPVSGPFSSRMGVYVDHRAGVLSFHSISETMTLLHRVQTIFTQPLYAGLELSSVGDTAVLCKLK
ncbi:tripartite motif-containing protein 16-like [Sphaeramia orbicularis]|uniref:tripartite motif-containing protein 16-like n=1 Tax=Sphaeramia orbicularis TaxID=375764 RepID=UPI00117CD3CE|nr:tripartite motif-containing protein 16-like [Sphaeramia orbicularis]